MPEDCPTERELTHLLDGALSPETVQSLETHLSTCEICLRQLDKLT